MSGGHGAADAALLQSHGKALLTAFYSAAQSLKLYPIENATVQKALDELHGKALAVVGKEGMLELRTAGDFLFLNDARLRLDLGNFAAFSFVNGLLARHGIGAVEVEPGVARDEWAPFLSLLLREAAADQPFDRFVERLAASPAEHVSVEPAADAGMSDEEQGQSKEVAKRTYAQSVQVAREVLTDVRLGKAVNVRRIKRAIQAVVDQVLTNETAMVGMTTLRDFDEYTFTHSVNVCIFSVVLGQKLGLTKLQLYELAMGALFHDIGKMRIDSAIVNKPDSFTDEEFEIMRQHPTEGLLSLFGMHGFGEVPYRAMLIAYEHHMRHGGEAGYPPSKRPREQTFLARLVAVADGFDAATSKRAYQSLPWRPEDVLREMRDNARRGYDPLLVKAFINVTGIFPVGTLVLLDTYELAVVVAKNPDPRRLHQPVVKILADSLGLPLTPPPVVDLAEVDPATGQPRRSIIKTTDPDRYGIRVADHIA